MATEITTASSSANPILLSPPAVPVQGSPQVDLDKVVDTAEREVDQKELTADERQAQFEALLKALEEMEAKKAEGAPADDFEIPPGTEKYFRAPLNRQLLERDYAAWKSALGIAKLMFGQASLTYQGITGSSALLAGMAYSLIYTIFPVGSVGLLSLYSGYCAVSNATSVFFGSESIQERKDSWNEAHLQPGYWSAFKNRFTTVFGSDSLFTRIGSGIRAAIQSYATLVGHDVLVNKATEGAYTAWAIGSMEFLKGNILKLPATLVSGGIGFISYNIALLLNSQVGEQINEYAATLYEDWRFSGKFDEVKYVSREEYHDMIAASLEIESYDDLEKARAEYKKNVLEHVSMRDYPGVGQIDFDANLALSLMNKKTPENALKAVVAQLLVLQTEKRDAIETYQTLLRENKLKDAQKHLNTTLKPMLFNIEFLKQTVLDPTRPVFGKVSPDGTSFYSYVSLLAGSELKWEIKATSPELISQEAREILTDEAALQKIIFHTKGKEFVQKVQKQAELEKDAESPAA